MIEIKLAMKKAYKSTEKANSKNSINSINQSITKKTLRNLPIGEGITYKELCDILGQKYYKGGNIKEKQLKEFFRYFDYEKIGNKFFIKEIRSNIGLAVQIIVISLLFGFLDNLKGNFASGGAARAVRGAGVSVRGGGCARQCGAD